MNNDFYNLKYKEKCDNVEDIKYWLKKLKRLSKNEIYDLMVDSKKNISPRTDFPIHSCMPLKTSKFTEKRFCRCLVGYNSNMISYCDGCKYGNNFRYKTNDIKCLDFEIDVTCNSKDGVGGIDLLFEYNNEKFMCEVKPIRNTNSIVHMLFEIITYYKLLGDEKEIFNNSYSSRGIKYEDFKLAIMFFRNSKQERQFNAYYNELIELLNKCEISVFLAEIINLNLKVEKVL